MNDINILKTREELKYGKSIFDLNLRVVYYSRVSTDSDEQVNSLGNQNSFFEDYINNAKNWKLVGKYIDEGISGTQVKNRTDFMKMIEDAKNGKFDMIITKEVSRFARNTIDSIKYTDDLLKMGVAVFFFNDNLNTIDETCEFRLTIMSSLAQDEVRKLSSRVKFGMERSVKDGRVLGGNNLTGYDKKDGKLYINEEETGLIRMLFNLYATGKYGFRTISDKLYDVGYKSSNGKRFADTVLIRMIQNPKYKGYYCGNKSYIEDYKTHKKIRKPKEEWLVYKDPNIPAIVSEEIWDKANALYNARRNFHSEKCGTRNYYKPIHCFSSKFVCKEHNATFTRVATGQRTNNPVWQCIEYVKHGLKCCQTPTLFERHLSEIFKVILDDFKINGDKVVEELLSGYALYINGIDNSNKIAAIEEKVIKLKKKKDKILELNIDGSLSNKEFKSKNDKCNEELELFTKELNNLKSISNNLDQKKEKINNLKDVITNMMGEEKDFTEIFNLLIQKVYVSKINNDRKHLMLDIEFNYGLANRLVEIYTNKGKNNDISSYFFDKKSLQLDANGSRS